MGTMAEPLQTMVKQSKGQKKSKNGKVELVRLGE